MRVFICGIVTILGVWCCGVVDAAAAPYLQWDPVTTYEDGSAIPPDTMITYYIVWSAGGQSFQRDTHNQTEYEISQLQLPAGTYDFQVCAVIEGAPAGDLSPAVQYTIAAEPPPVIVKRPAQVQGVRIVDK
jgi:hypothetical protein